MLLATAATEGAARGLAPIVLVIVIAALVLRPFRRRIGGARGGAEKAIVGILWVVAGVVIAIAIST